MISSAITNRITETGVRLRIDSEDATIDMGHSRAFPIMVKVSELAINYKTSETCTGDEIGAVSEVTGITYLLTEGEDPMAFVHPDFLEKPEEWPVWVRDLVDEHRPRA